MSRRKIVAGNWKMNKNNNDALQLIRDILATDLPRDIHTVPVSYTHLTLPTIYSV